MRIEEQYKHINRIACCQSKSKTLMILRTALEQKLLFLGPAHIEQTTDFLFAGATLVLKNHVKDSLGPVPT